MRPGADELTRPSWSCVHFADEAPDDDRLREAGLHAAQIDGSRLDGRDSLMNELDSALGFPDYFGRNWDALEEVLRDLSWLPAEGYVVTVTDADDLWRRDPRLAGKLVRTWLFCAESWAARERPFHLVFAW